MLRSSDPSCHLLTRVKIERCMNLEATVLGELEVLPGGVVCLRAPSFAKFQTSEHLPGGSGSTELVFEATKLFRDWELLMKSQMGCASESKGHRKITICGHLCRVCFFVMVLKVFLEVIKGGVGHATRYQAFSIRGFDELTYFTFCSTTLCTHTAPQTFPSPSMFRMILPLLSCARPSDVSW